MLHRIHLIIGALALIGATGAIAADCATTTTEQARTQRVPATDVSYSRSSVRGVSYELSGVPRATAEDRSYPRRSAMSSYTSSATSTTTFGNGIGRGRKENLP